MKRTGMRQAWLGAALAAAVWAFSVATTSAQTGGNVTWDGGGATPFWNDANNWAGNLYPTNPTSAQVLFGADLVGQSVTGKLEEARTIGSLRLASGWDAWGQTPRGQRHTIDLNGYRLTLVGHLTTDQGDAAAANRYLTFIGGGIVQFGSDTAESDLQLYGLYGGNGVVTFAAGTTLDSYRMGTLRIGSAHSGSNRGWHGVDLRGASVTGGILTVKNLYITTKSGQDVGLMFDSTTALDTLKVTNELDYGDSAYNGGNAYIGNPSTLKLPANVNVQVGNGSSARANRLRIGRGATVAQLIASTNGWFKAYVADLTIGDPACNGTLDIRAMTNCAIEATTFTVCKESGTPSATPKAEARLCPGTVTAGTVALGSTVSGGYGLLEMSNTLFIVTNSYTLNTTATNLISVGSDSKGLDVQGALANNGGRIRVRFMEDPPAGATNWAIRVKGNAKKTLGALVGSGRIMATQLVANVSKKIGYLYDPVSDYSYYALVDTSVPFTPLAIARASLTCELAPSGTVLVGTNDVNNGSFDPAGRTPIAFSISTNGIDFASSLAFDAVGDYTVTLRMEVGSPVEATDTDTGTVRVIAVHPGVTSNLTWKGGAASALMDRREWMWSGNWLEGVPPSNPTPGTISYKTSGQSVTGVVEQSRTVGGIFFDSGVNGSLISHTLNLGGNTLTLAGALNGEYYRSWSMRMTNGTFRLGTATQAASLGVGRMGAATLTLAPGMSLDPVNVSSIYLGEYNSSGSGNAILDLRGCTIVGGALRMVNLTLSGYTAQSAFIYLDGNTAIDSINVSNNLTFGYTSADGMTYVGNPVDGKLPPNISVSVGVSPAQRGNLVMSLCSSFVGVRTNKLVASSGGTFTAFVTNLWVSANHAINTTAAQYGLLDVSRMNACTLDVQNLLLATDKPASPLATDNYQGELRLCPGTAKVGLGVIGAITNAGFGLLTMSNTTFVVTNTFTIQRTGRVRIDVGAQAAGLVVSNAADTALSLATATNGALRIVFNAPAAAHPFYGLWWKGDHAAALQAMRGDGRLVIDDAALGKPAAVVYYKGNTYVGLPPPAGTVVVVR